MGVRHNLMSLSIKQKKDFVHALLVMKERGIYDTFVEMHHHTMMKATPSGL